MTDTSSITQLISATLLSDRAGVLAYHNAPLPNDRDRSIEAVIDAYLALPVDERRALVKGLTFWQLSTLSSFSSRMTMVAARTMSRERLTRAAVALVLSHVGSDPRELLLALPVLCRASTRIDAGVDPFLEAAAAALDADTARIIRDYAGGVSIGCGSLPGGLHEVEGPNGVIWINKNRPVPEGW